MKRAQMNRLMPILALLIPVAAAAEETTGLPHAFDAGWKGEQTCALLFEGSGVRVGKCIFPPGIGHEKHYHNPHFGYVLEGSTLRIWDASGERDVETVAGGTWSTDAVTVHEAVNIGDSKTSYLIVEPKREAAGEPARGDDEATLRHFKTVLWPQAYRTQDTDLLDRMLHDSFQMIDAEGNRSTKAAEIAWVSENQWNPGSFTYRIERLDIFNGGTMAIIDGTGVAERYSYQSSNILIKDDGEWRAVASHVSGFRATGPQGAD